MKDSSEQYDLYSAKALLVLPDDSASVKYKKNCATSCVNLNEIIIVVPEVEEEGSGIHTFLYRFSNHPSKQSFRISVPHTVKDIADDLAIIISQKRWLLGHKP